MEFISIGIEGILNEPNQYNYVGKERVKKLKNNIFVYIDKIGGSYRFVKKEENKTISGLQIMYDENRVINPVIANVITLEKYRSKGLATELLQTATLFFNKKIQHSQYLNDNSRAWIKKLNKINL